MILLPWIRRCTESAHPVAYLEINVSGHDQQSPLPFLRMIDQLSVTKTTYTIVDFLEWQRQRSLDLRPVYQRRSVWNPRVKSLLIDSIIRGYPIPLIFLHNRLDVNSSRTVRHVVDGQQRLRTILAFIDIDSITEPEEWDRFTVLKSHNPDYSGLSFQQLDSEVQSRILETQLSVNVLPADVDDVTILEIFQRLNTTGLKLSDQEIRNATYFGEFKETAYQLAYSQYQRWLKWGVFKKQDVAQMKEVEFTSDLMGLLLKEVNARSKSVLDGLYKLYDSEIRDRDQLVKTFSETCDRLEEIYSPDRSRSGLKRFLNTGWFYSVFALTSGADLVDLDGNKWLDNAPQFQKPGAVNRSLQQPQRRPLPVFSNREPFLVGRSSPPLQT